MLRLLKWAMILIGLQGYASEYGGIESETDLSGYAALVSELDERKRLQFLFPNPQSLFDGLHAGFVATSTGHLTFERRDLVLLNAGALVISRIYDSRSMSDSGMGVGWRLNIQQTVRQVNDGLIYHESNGNSLRFKRDLSGEYLPTDPTPRTDGTFAIAIGNTLLVHDVDSSEKVFARTAHGDIFRLVSVIDDNGNVINLHYDSSRLVAVSVNKKLRISIMWRHGAIVQLADEHGRRVNYEYDRLGRLYLVEDIAGQAWTYSYGHDHKLKQASYPNGHSYLAVDYDDQGRVASVDSSRNHSFEYAEGRTTVQTGNINTLGYIYNEKGVTTTLTKNDEIRWEIVLDERNRPSQLVKNQEQYEISYTSNSMRIDHPYGWVKFEKAKDNQFVYYDGINPDGFLKFSFEAMPSGSTRVVNHERDLEYVLDSQNRISELTKDDVDYSLSRDENGLITRVVQGDQQLSLMRDELGRITEIEYPNGQSSGYVYDALGNRIIANFSNGNSMHLKHDGRGNITHVDDVTTGGMTLRQRYHVNSKNQVTSVEFPMNLTLAIDYNQQGQPSLFSLGNDNVQVRYDVKQKFVGLQSGMIEWTPSQLPDYQLFLSYGTDTRATLHNDKLNNTQPDYGLVIFDQNVQDLKLEHPENQVISQLDTALVTLMTIESWFNEDVHLKFEKPSNSVFQPPEYKSTNCCMSCAFNPLCGQICTGFIGISEFTCICLKIGPLYVNGGASNSGGGGGGKSCSNKTRGQWGRARATIEENLSKEKYPAVPYENGGIVDCNNLSQYIPDDEKGSPGDYCITLNPKKDKTVYMGHVHPYFDPSTIEVDMLKKACCVDGEGTPPACINIGSVRERNYANEANKECSLEDKRIGNEYPLLLRWPTSNNFDRCH